MLGEYHEFVASFGHYLGFVYAFVSFLTWAVCLRWFRGPTFTFASAMCVWVMLRQSVWQYDDPHRIEMQIVCLLWLAICFWLVRTWPYRSTPRVFVSFGVLVVLWTALQNYPEAVEAITTRPVSNLLYTSIVNGLFVLLVWVPIWVGMALDLKARAVKAQ